MRGLIFLLIWYIFYEFQIGNDNADNKIIWSKERLLTWSDFQAKPDSSILEKEDASISSQISISYQKNKTKLHFNVKCYFEKEKSWTITTTSSYLLEHEQIHFDIAEIYARSLRKELQVMQTTPNNEIEAKIKELYHKTIEACVSFQNKYDSETNHSRNRTKQQIWKERVNGILNQTEAYKLHEIVIVKK